MMGRFGEFLIGEGKLRPEQLKKAMEIQGLVGGRLGSNLLELGLMHEESLLEALGKFRQTRTASAHELKNVNAETLGLVPPKIAERHHIVPVEHRGHTLVLASMDPGDPLLEDELGHMTACLVRTVIGLELRIHEALTRYYGMPQTPRLTGLARRLDGRGEPRAAVPAAAAEPPPEPGLGPAPPPPTPRATPPRRAARAAPEDASKPSLQYIELDDITRARIYTESPDLKSPSERLAAAADELERISIRDEIADVLLDYCRPYLRRRLLLIHRKENLAGWRGEGGAIDRDKVRALEIPVDEPSVFRSLLQGTSFWLGPLVPSPVHERLIASLGGPAPKDCLVLPVELRSRVVCLLYGDNEGEGVGAAPLPELKRLVRKAGVAFEVCILKHKIRTL